MSQPGQTLSFQTQRLAPGISLRSLGGDGCLCRDVSRRLRSPHSLSPITVEFLVRDDGQPVRLGAREGLDELRPTFSFGHVHPPHGEAAPLAPVDEGPVHQDGEGLVALQSAELLPLAPVRPGSRQSKVTSLDGRPVQLPLPVVESDGLGSVQIKSH